jgi:sec-independent protein translocase protein TatC
MATNLLNAPETDDPFAASRMPFTAHLEVLRWHLWRALAGLVVGMVLSIPVGHQALQLIAAPVKAELDLFQERRIERAAALLAGGDPFFVAANQPRQVRLLLQEPDGTFHSQTVWIEPVDFFLALARADRLVNHPPALSTMSITEAFMVYFKVCLYCGVIISSPWVFYQLWSFVAAGLYPHERSLVRYYLPFSVGLFLAGVAVCELLAMRNMVGFLLGFNEMLDLNPDLRLNEWLSFALFVPLAFGVAFQTPVVMIFINRLGIVSASWYRRNRRMAYMGLAVFAAMITAGPDPMVMMMLAAPMWLLYEIGILLCRAEGRG